MARQNNEETRQLPVIVIMLLVIVGLISLVDLGIILASLIHELQYTGGNHGFGKAYGAWYIPLTENITLNVGDNVPYDTLEVSRGITNDGAGLFTLPDDGTYLATYSTASCCFSYFFDLILNTNMRIAGSEFDIDSQFERQGPNPLRVTFDASAGDTVSLQYVASVPAGHIAILGSSGSTTRITEGPNVDKQPVAYIAIQRIA